MIVYVVTSELVYDGQFMGFDPDVKVFSTKEKAEEIYNNFKSDELEFAKENGWQVEESKDSFETWKDGEYSMFHTIGRLLTKIVR